MILFWLPQGSGRGVKSEGGILEGGGGDTSFSSKQLWGFWGFKKMDSTGPQVVLG